MADEILKRDQNHVTVLGGVTNDIDQDVTMLRVDPISKRLLIAATISGSGVVTSVSNSDGSLSISPTTGTVVASLNTAHTNDWSVIQNFNGELLNSYTVSAPTGVVTCTINYDIGGNWTAGNYAQYIRVYSYKDTPVGRVYSSTYLQSANFPPIGAGATAAEFDWGGWVVPGDADGIILVRFSGDPVQPMNYDYYIDVGANDFYNDYGDEWGTLNINFPTTVNQYGYASTSNGAIQFSPDYNADSLAIIPILRAGADNALQGWLNYEQQQFRFTDSMGNAASVYGSFIGPSANFTSASITDLYGTFHGTTNNSSATALSIALWDSGKNLYSDSGFKWGRDSNGPVLSIGPNSTTNGSFRLWLNDSGASSVQMLFTNSITGNTLSDGYAVGIDNQGGALFNNRENTNMRWATNNAFTLQLNATGELNSGNSSFLGNQLSQFGVQNIAGATTKITTIFKPIASQTGDLTQWTDSTTVAVTKVNAIGNIGVRMGATALTAYLHLAAGTTAASTAPLKFTSGSLQTTAEAGAVEFLTDKWYGTITTGAARKEFTLNDAALTSGKIPQITTNGRLTDSTGTGYVKTSSGTVSYQATPIPVADGGTGQTTSRIKFTHTTDANNGTTVETDLYSDTLAAGQLGTNGDIIEGQYGGIFTSIATSTQQLKVYFGGTVVFDSGALSIGLANNSWELFVTVIRVSSSVVRCATTLTTSFASLSAYTVYTEVTGLTLANSQVMKITGTAGGVSGGSSQITAKEGYIEFKN